MKNTTKIMGLLLFVAIIGFSFSACEDDSGKDALDGTTWKQEHVTGAVLVLKFNKPNFTLTQTGPGDLNITDTGTYSTSGSTVTLTYSDGKTIEGRLNNNNLFFEGYMDLTKQ